MLGDFAGVPAARAVLHKWFHADSVDPLVQKQPLFLVEDVEDAIASLNRCGLLANLTVMQRSSLQVGRPNHSIQAHTVL